MHNVHEISVIFVRIELFTNFEFSNTYIYFFFVRNHSFIYTSIENMD